MAVHPSPFDVNSLPNVQTAVVHFYDQRKAGDHSEWTQWLRPNVPAPEPVKTAIAQRCSGDQMLKSCGCGLPFPESLAGARVLDVGCGSGADCMVLSQLVGREGKVVGLDICPTLITDARRHAAEAGCSNVTFVCDDAENMTSNPEVLSHGPYDVIVANCSFCLMRNCARDDLASQVYSLLKPGGEFYICDIFVSIDVSECARRSPQAWVEGFAGAWMWDQFTRSMEVAEFTQPLLVTSRKLEITDERRRQLAAAMGVFGEAVEKLKALEDASGIQICAATYRLFRPAPPSNVLTQLLESKANAARITYLPGASCANPFVQLSRKVLCRKSLPVVVSKNTAVALLQSRLASMFTVVPTASVVRMPPESSEPFFPKPLKPGKIATSPHTMPLGGLTLLNGIGSGLGGPAPALSQPAGASLATILGSNPALKGLRDMVQKTMTGGCGPGGC